MALVSATETELNDFLTKYGLSITSDKSILLNKSLAFMSGFKYCSDVSTVEAQCWITEAMANHGFNPFSVSDSGPRVTEKTVQAGSVKTSKKFSDVKATEMDKLKSVPQAYTLLSDALCAGSSVGVGILVV